MIRQILISEKNIVLEFAKRDIGRNYFILLGLSSQKSIYDKIYGEFREGELQAILLKRKSGTLQFFARDRFDLLGFKDIILELDSHLMIGPKSYCKKFFDIGLFSSFKEGAYISKLENDYKIKPFTSKYNIRKVKLDDLEKIVELYSSVFSSFAPKEIMEERLRTKRGRGVLIEKDGEILSVCQSDFETKKSALIIGVATKEEYRFKGLATECLQILIEILTKEGKDLYLQYDNLEAGHIYKKLGFKAIDQVIHLKRGD